MGAQAAAEQVGAYVFVNERSAPIGRMGIARMIERAGAEAGIGFPVHVHMLRHAAATPWRTRGWTRGGSSTTSAIPQSQTLFAIPR